MKKYVWLLVGAFILTSGCSSSRVERVSPDKVTDLSGTWNDSDARMVAEEMVKECLNGKWLPEFNQANSNKAPVVIIGDIKNKTYEHISPDVFINSLQKALLDSGRVQFVANKEERAEVREERQDQQVGNTEPSTIIPVGHETGADFMLQGNINAIKESVEDQRLMVGKKKSTSFFQVTLELIDLKTNQKRWIAQKEIKKSIERRKVF